MSNEYPSMVRVIEATSDLYAEPRIESSIIKTIEIGDVIHLGKTIKKNGKQWVEAMCGNEKGFILGDAMIFTIQKAKLNQKDVDIYEKPFSESKIKGKYNKSDVFYLTDKITKDGKEWVKARDLSNNVGYLDGDTQIEIIAPLPDMKSDLGSWGIGLIVIGIISNLIPNFLDARWGIIVIILGCVVLAVRKRFMYIVLGIGLFIVGAMNLLSGNPGGWTVFGFFQLYWGFQEIQKFWKYKKLEEKGVEDKDILLNIEQDKTEIEDLICNETVEVEGSISKEKLPVEVIDGIWSCPGCGVRSRADCEICDECGQSVELEV
ncbi:MAG: hypothetical protein GY853_05470 [PVC group bacterium]|nr:hypothetical protein [PVC group bacterium]